MASKKVTNEMLDYKINQVLETLREHRDEFKTHVVEDNAMKKDVDRLVVAQENRRKHLWVIYPALLTMALAWLKSWLPS